MTTHAHVEPNPLRIVVVEDDDDSRDTLCEVLTSLGHHVSSAADGVAGRALILARCPDVALVDVGLPGLTGYELVKQVRQFPQMARTRLVALTGWGPETRELALAAGFDAHATKPLDLDTLESLLTD